MLPSVFWLPSSNESNDRGRLTTRPAEPDSSNANNNFKPPTGRPALIVGQKTGCVGGSCRPLFRFIGARRRALLLHGKTRKRLQSMASQAARHPRHVFAPRP